MLVWGDFLQVALAPFLTNLIKCFGFGGTDSILLVNLFRVAKIWDNTLSCLKVKCPCLRATQHAPKMCEVVDMVLLHRKPGGFRGDSPAFKGTWWWYSIKSWGEAKQDKVDWWCKQPLPWEILLDVTQPPSPLLLEWKLSCFWNVISRINFFEGPIDKGSVAFGRLFFKGFGSVYIPDSMVSLVMITSHLLKLNVLFCHIHSFLNLPGTSLQLWRAVGDKWVMLMF